MVQLRRHTGPKVSESSDFAVSKGKFGNVKEWSDHLPTTYWPLTDPLPTTYRPSTDHLPTIYRPLTDHLPTIYRPLTDHLPTTYRPLFLRWITGKFGPYLLLGTEYITQRVLKKRIFTSFPPHKNREVLRILPITSYWSFCIIDRGLSDREDAKKLAEDAMFKLEHGVQDVKKSKAAAPALEHLKVR